jgi:nucleotide-binding universal stress UspA family protein
VYKKFLFAYDGSRDGRIALIEGADLAEACKGEVVLLAVVNDAANVAAAQAYASGAPLGEESEQTQAVLDEGLQSLRDRGLTATASLAFGSPAERIASMAREVGADVVVIGHREQGLWARWLNEPVGAYLMKNLPCSLLVVAAKQ